MAQTALPSLQTVKVEPSTGASTRMRPGYWTLIVKEAPRIDPGSRPATWPTVARSVRARSEDCLPPRSTPASGVIIWERMSYLFPERAGSEEGVVGSAGEVDGRASDWETMELLSAARAFTETIQRSKVVTVQIR